MFADSLLESAPHLGHRSAWTKLVSVSIQSLALAVALAIPLFHLERLEVIPPPPSIRLTSAAPPEVRSEPERFSSRAPAETRYEIVQPHTIPRTVGPVNDRDRGQSGPPDVGNVCVSSCSGGGLPLTGIVPPGSFKFPPPPPVRGPVPVSVMQLGELIRKVVPEYPIAAKQLHVQGQVLLTAIVGKDGRVEHVTTMSGPPLLVLAAKRAVEQWQYRPYLLNHQPVEVETQITVNFVLNKD